MFVNVYKNSSDMYIHRISTCICMCTLHSFHSCIHLSGGQHQSQRHHCEWSMGLIQCLHGFNYYIFKEEWTQNPLIELFSSWAIFNTIIGVLAEICTANIYKYPSKNINKSYSDSVNHWQLKSVVLQNIMFAFTKIYTVTAFISFDFVMFCYS